MRVSNTYRVSHLREYKYLLTMSVKVEIYSQGERWGCLKKKLLLHVLRLSVFLFYGKRMKVIVIISMTNANQYQWAIWDLCRSDDDDDIPHR